MKRFLAWILLASLLLTTVLLASCGNEAETSSQAQTSNGANGTTDASGDVSGEISEDQPPVENLVGGPIQENPFASVISTGTTYTVSGATPGEDYPDSYSSEMTDGKMAPASSADYNDAAYTGFHSGGTSYMTIVLDLGEVYDKIYSFKVGYLSTTNAGIRPPEVVSVSISKDGDTYTNMGDLEIPEFVEGCRLEATLTGENYLKARYVKFVIKKTGWLFLDEIQVIADVESSAAVGEMMVQMVQEAYTTLGTVSFSPAGIAPDFTKARETVSKGCTYTLSAETVKRFPDSGSPLTDGQAAGIYETGKFVGFEGGQPISVVVDLGKVRDDLYRFEMMCYANASGGNFLPVAVTYAISEDGENYTDIGRVFAPTSGQSSYDYPLSFTQCVSARYVRFTAESTETSMFLLEETGVYVRVGTTGLGSLYPAVVLDDSEKEWENPSSTEKNLIAGVLQQVYVPSDAKNVTLSSCSAWDLPVLTDGWKANPNNINDNHIHNERYFKFQSTSAPMEFFFDLGATSAVKRFTAQFTHRTSWGVQAPAKVDVFLSMDGQQWYLAGSVETNPQYEDRVVDVELTLDKKVQARFVSFSFNTCNWCGISEFEVFGTTSTSGAQTPGKAGLVTKEDAKKGYLAPSDDLLNGNKDLCLLYQRADRNLYTANMLLPYVAYLDEQGNIKDTMFDSFLFLMSGNLPSGRNPLGEGNMEDMQWTIDNLFLDGYNLLALEEAAGKVKEALGLSADFKYGFTVTLYDLDPQGTNFGDINGDGKAEATNTWEKRVEAIKWYMDAFEAKYAQYTFENLEFLGYYWYREGVYPENDQPKVISALADEIHARGFDFIWIPWYCAPGADSWKDYGFDASCMQPNYVFDLEEPEGRIAQAAYLIQMYGCGIEIEVGFTAMQNEALRNRYLEYLSGGVKFGYMKDCMHMYYQELDVYHATCKSSDPKIRVMYDYTYQFIKGTLNAYPAALETVKVEAAADAPTSVVLFENPSAHLSVVLAGSPEHGSVTFGNDGVFTYYPEPGFSGTVTITYTFNEGLGDSEICTVEITVP